MNTVYHYTGLIVIWGVAICAVLYGLLWTAAWVWSIRTRLWLYQAYDFWNWKITCFDVWKANNFTDIGNMDWNDVLIQIIKYQGGYNKTAPWPIDKHIYAEKIVQLHKEMADSPEGQKNIKQLTTLLEMARKNKYYDLPFPEFWFEGNLYFGWIKSREDLEKVFASYEGNMTRDEVLDKSKECTTATGYIQYGLRSECNGEKPLRWFLKEEGHAYSNHIS